MEIDPELRRSVKKYLTFSRREYQATLVIFLFALTCHYLADIRSWLYPVKYDMEKIRQEAALLSTEQAQESKDTASTTELRAEQKTNALFPFDPNAITRDEWTRLGLNSRQVNIILNYLQKGGKFKSSGDLKKIYGITSAEYDRLEPYIVIRSDKRKYLENKNQGSEHSANLSVELNTADSIALDRLPGIGFGFARRIIKYREALGGFYSDAQLLEVYGFRQSLLDSIRPFIRIDISLIRHLHINSATVDDLKKHPYLRYKLASAIVNYRAQHGPFRIADDLKEILLFDSVTIDRLKPYLVMD
jgi:competence protein ComEA